MKRWSETLNLSLPLREVRVAAVLPPAEAWEKLLRQREQASYEQGRQEGERALSEQLLRQRSELADLQNGVLASLRQTVSQIARESESAVVSLALEVARKLVAGMPVSVEMIEAAVHEALGQLESGTEFTLFLHPEDLALLQKVDSSCLTSVGAWERMQVRSSHEVSRGGCLVQTRFGFIDGCRETKLELLQKSLKV